MAGIIGNLIRRNASISGAECGCQAEIGSACSMAAAAMCELMEFPIEQIEYAAEIAMEHHLGLTCDPICGLVQIPCIERNAVAAKRAIDSANLAHMLVGTRTISFDMVVRTMYETGISMNRAFRETSEGGLAQSLQPPRRYRPHPQITPKSGSAGLFRFPVEKSAPLLYNLPITIEPGLIARARRRCIP